MYIYDFSISWNNSLINKDRMFHSLDLIQDEVNDSNVFVSYQVLHRETFSAYLKNTFHFFIYNLPTGKEKFLNIYDEFMENYKYANRKGRYAVQLKVLYPKSIVWKNKREAFIKEYIRQLVQTKVNVHYVVENISQGRAQYALITILERVYLGIVNWKIYMQNKYIDSRTGKWASKDCPDKFKVLKCKKGEYQRDSKGNPKKINEAQFSKSLRIFRYAVDPTTGRNMFYEFIQELKLKVISAMKRIYSKGVKNGKVLHKRQIKKTYHNLIRRRIAAINTAKQIVEYTTNYILLEEQKNDRVFQPYNYAKAPIVKHSERYHQMIAIFEKYRNRFKKEEFHDMNGNLRKIKHCYQRVDEVEENIRILIKMFKSEVEALKGEVHNSNKRSKEVTLI